MILFIRREGEDDWPLHFHAASMIIPYFCSRGHQNYVRYGLYYLHDLRKLPPVMFIEAGFMRYGIVAGGGGGYWTHIEQKVGEKVVPSLRICTVIIHDL